ncbi:TRAP transporter large permease subunit [Propionimicrobium sp. PCR01-08-3]|uniref:TRAP transporter large permease subunit n=1 Tax=Propionimicrobium sp. PCR01-08-3 TaxID=3052086 RepID=UPI00255C9160|nr:TRAP transporter large permease subunit [Propionimicrobium sp. PCR01-08-3]WIY84241.1 TRAP transporter large permease subunit [Propionimicrobium sp. PCR01-08-3]
MAIWALVVYLAVIVVGAVVLKRGIGESMVVAFVVLCVFGGKQFLSFLWLGIESALDQPVVFAALAFVFVGYLLGETGIISHQVNILNSLLGRFKGGPGYVATVASAGFGALTHSAAANAATIGSVTVPWMQKSNFKSSTAATVIAGNSGNGTVIPPSAAYLIVVGLATVQPNIDSGNTLLVMFVVAGYTVLWRLLCVYFFVRQGKAGKPDPASLMPMRQSWSQGWFTLLVYLGILIPLLLTMGPGPALFNSLFGEETGKALVKGIDILIWMPVLLGLIGLLVGRKQLPKSGKEWFGFVSKVAPRYKDIGATLVFSFAGSAVLLELGLDQQLQTAITSLHLPAILTTLIVVVVIVLVGGPLSATATAATIAGAAFAVLTAIGVDPALAVATIMVSISTADASPPGGPAIFIGSGIAQVDPGTTFKPLILYYVLPFIIFAVAIAMGVVPTPA